VFTGKDVGIMFNGCWSWFCFVVVIERRLDFGG